MHMTLRGSKRSLALAGKHSNRGFTLLEVLITLSLVTVLSLILVSSVSPWISFKQRIDTDRRLQEMKDALEFVYRSNAMAAGDEAGRNIALGGGTLLANTVPNAAGACEEIPDDARGALASFLAEGPDQGTRDGFGAPFCYFVSNRLNANREGISLFYHTVAIVSTGNGGVVDAGTAFDPDTGILTLDPDGDDMAAVMSGLPIQYELYKDTKRRVDRAAEIYSTYFTTRFLSNAARDYTIDYFVQGALPNYDPGGTAVSTGGDWLAAGVALGALGLGPEEQTSAFEANSDIEVANVELDAGNIIAGVQVQDPLSKTTAGLPVAPPYTAIFRARLPGPADNYLLKVVPGNY
jgi:prepilin-type N-terminal cleavage/methylation domain-containing protein